MQSFRERLCAFYSGKWYPLLAVLLALVGHTTGWDIAFFVIMVCTVLVGCIFTNDLRFAITPFLCTVMFVTPEHSPNVPSYSDYYLQPLPLTVLVIAFSLILIGVIIFGIRNSARAHRIPRKGLFVSIAVLCAAVCLNGILNPNYTVENLLYALSFALALLGIYLLFAVFVRFDETISDYFMYCLVCIGMLISAQMLLTYATTVQFANGAVVKESVVLGWGVWTTVGGVQAFLIPACFYFAAEHKRGWIFYLLGLLEALCTVLSQSRGAMLVGGGTLVLCLVAVCFFGKNRKINRIITLCLVVVGIAGVIVLREQVIALLSNFINRGFNDNGRYELWEIGFKQFLSYPIFGSGFYDSGIVQDWHIEVYPYFYHNTVVQILGSTGVIGTLAYLWHRFCTVRLVLHTPSLFKSFLGIGILSLLAFCMLDVLLFITYPLMFYALMLLFMEKSDV